MIRKKITLAFWKTMCWLDDNVNHRVGTDRFQIGFEFCQWSSAGLIDTADKYGLD